MSKKRAIVKYENLSIDQKKQLIRDFPAGILDGMQSVKLPTGDSIEVLIWETDEAINLVKFTQQPLKPKKKAAADDDDDDIAGLDDDIDDEGIESEDDEATDDEEEDEYDKADDDKGEDDEKEEED